MNEQSEYFGDDLVEDIRQEVIASDDGNHVVEVSNPVTMTNSASMPLTQESPSKADSMLTIIEKVAMSPDADISKLERMLDLQERIIDKNAAAAFAADMAACQADLPSVVKQARNDQTRSNFARFEDILETTRQTYTRHGFAISFGTAESPVEQHIRITCEITHKQGHSKDYFVDLPIDNAGMTGKVNKTLMHGTASTMTYGRRYLFCMIFNIALKDADNDGNTQQLPQAISVEQAAELKKLLQDTSSDVKAFCKAYRTDCVDNLSATMFNHAKKAIESKLK